MLLVRTAHGRVKLHTEDAPIEHGTPRTCDSYVTAMKNEFREFILHMNKQTYPEYVVLYDRVNINSKK